MLNGVAKLTLDDKGRIAFPSRYRENLMEECAGNMVMTVDHEDRLIIYPHYEWEKVEITLQKLSSFKKAEARIKRLYLGHAHDCKMDKNGRITIPPYLREKTKLEKKVVLLGVGNKFELWDDSSWEQEWESDDSDIEITEELESLSL
ncbi:MAG: division/cell wall cluster transcriptional repressor MraZ [Pseudomonadota bacterium]